jgi:hypothetical protein
MTNITRSCLYSLGLISDPEVASSQSKEIFLCVPAWYEVGCIYKNII